MQNPFEILLEQLSKIEQRPKQEQRFQVLYRILEEKPVLDDRALQPNFMHMGTQKPQRKTMQTSIPYFDVPEWVRRVCRAA